MFVGGIAPTVTDEELLEFGAVYGDVADAIVMKDRHSGKSRCF